MSDNSAVKYFAVNTLGCGCKESVFRDIESDRNFGLQCGVILYRKILIGKRLLIYIADSANLNRGDLLHIVKEGLAERDSKGYNRLRVVIASENPSREKSIFENEFSGIHERDEKTHIHVLSLQEIPQ